MTFSPDIKDYANLFRSWRLIQHPGRSFLQIRSNDTGRHRL